MKIDFQPDSVVLVVERLEPIDCLHCWDYFVVLFGIFVVEVVPFDLAAVAVAVVVAFEWAFLAASVALFEDAAMMDFTSDQIKSNVTTINDKENFSSFFFTCCGGIWNC